MFVDATMQTFVDWLRKMACLVRHGRLTAYAAGPTRSCENSARSRKTPSSYPAAGPDAAAMAPGSMVWPRAADRPRCYLQTNGATECCRRCLGADLVRAVAGEAEEHHPAHHVAEPGVRWPRGRDVARIGRGHCPVLDRTGSVSPCPQLRAEPGGASERGGCRGAACRPCDQSRGSCPRNPA